MSPHVTDALWDWARGKLPAEQAQELEAHLPLCADCAQKAEQTKAAQRVLALAQGPAPAPPRAFWQNVDARVLSEVRARDSRGFGGWAAGWLRPALVAGALAALALVAWVALSPAPTAPPGTATVAEGGVLREAPLEEGEAVTTRTEEAVASLPEGSTVGVRPGSRVRFVKLSKQAVQLALEAGEVSVAASHREGRSFVVRAGEVEVRVVGTRFVVSREEAGTVVEVFEGRVEVRRGDEVRHVDAGQRITMPPRPPPGEVPPAAAPELAFVPAPPSPAQPLSEGRSRSKAPEAPATAPRSDSPSRLSDPVPEPLPAPEAPRRAAPPALPSPSPPPGPPEDHAQAPAAAPQGAPEAASEKSPRRHDVWPSKPLGDWKKWADVDWLSDVVPPGVSAKEYRARQLGFLADANRCEAVEERARRWLNLYGAEAKEDAQTRELEREVRFNFARCLQKLGRSQEAEAIRQGR